MTEAFYEKRTGGHAQSTPLVIRGYAVKTISTWKPSMSKLGTIALRGLSLSYLGAHEKAVLRRIGDCQTPRMGGNDLDCKCGHREVHYNSCRDRNCPLCQIPTLGPEPGVKVTA